MKVTRGVLSGLLTIFLLGCSLRGKQQASIPPPVAPKPVVSQPEPEPPPVQAAVSIPQTRVQLPTPQPISEEALSSIPSNSPSRSDAPGPARNPRRASSAPAVSLPSSNPMPPPSQPAASGIPSPTVPRTEVSQSQPEALPAQPVEEQPRPRIRPVLSAAERRQKSEEIESRWREVNSMLTQASNRQLSDEQLNTVNRIKSFLSMSEEALRRGDIRQADALSDRALLLAGDLPGAR